MAKLYRRIEKKKKSLATEEAVVLYFVLPWDPEDSENIEEDFQNAGRINSDDDDDTVDDPDFLPPNGTNGEPNSDSADKETLEDSTQNENPDIKYLWSESQQPKVIPNF
ncbi:hypothetical protein CDAR_510871 [Caerostris darwini]|uniref:Uncharacterized protein n=1 Tax=Caerostris darwini TaxID=1538125 RepID=A0AAV4TAH3_9ARAC|nr:hypothetical protein CDAR_510871 [Caerostris darwini]